MRRWGGDVFLNTLSEGWKRSLELWMFFPWNWRTTPPPQWKKMTHICKKKLHPPFFVYMYSFIFWVEGHTVIPTFIYLIFMVFMWVNNGKYICTAYMDPIGCEDIFIGISHDFATLRPWALAGPAGQSPACCDAEPSEVGVIQQLLFV